MRCYLGSLREDPICKITPLAVCPRVDCLLLHLPPWFIFLILHVHSRSVVLSFSLVLCEIVYIFIGSSVAYFIIRQCKHECLKKVTPPPKHIFEGWVWEGRVPVTVTRGRVTLCCYKSWRYIQRTWGGRVGREGTYPEACKDVVGRVRDLMKGLVGRGGYCREEKGGISRVSGHVWSRLLHWRNPEQIPLNFTVVIAPLITCLDTEGWIRAGLTKSDTRENQGEG